MTDKSAVAAKPELHQDTATSAAEVALARLYGEPLFTIPQDLYIPPEALEIILEAFEGPLDLLLYLIRKQNFNVLDIPMAQVTAQYLAYVEQVRLHNLELAGEYLLMAAVLIEIKSRMLLPVRKSDTGEEVEDPRAELVRRLLEYERIKSAAQQINEFPQQGRDYLVAAAHLEIVMEELLPEVSADDLQQAWLSVIKRAKLHASHKITREQLSVRDHMTQILRRLQSVRFMEFTELFMERIEHGDGAAILVVHFLAMLELARESLLDITQAEPYAPIYLRLSYDRALV
ncbi:segregation and condensation protein A [Alcaligenes endophyticus]|uniref:Segregation and condensation protein A n=1 Tax=Alcaligenes endophyticus TaxID=1929088 RepID=A0ABT8EG60_9BURK|nr:ScpA family protein [Alcaligenes endophyticus]MCX5590087.1 ScpA family protein [Alcaligenes endophyticus]MDN4120250.1 segregation/condensation protein A [Alcaligenes endophyticus]